MSRAPRTSSPAPGSPRSRGPASSAGSERVLPARPLEEMTTQLVPSMEGGRRPGARRGPLAFTRTLRWRLALSFASVFAVLLVTLGLALNVILGRILYTEDLQSFKADTVATVDTRQREYTLELNGRQPGCVDAVSYQQAFQETIATSLIRSNGVSQVYLLDRLGNVLMPETGSIAVGDPGPFLQAATFAAVRRSAVQAGASAPIGVIMAGAGAYMLTTGGQRVGVVLIPERYHTASTCINTRNVAVGIVEVVTFFPRVQRTLDTIHLVLALSILAVLAIVALIAGPLTAQAMRPLTRMTRTARRIASGDLSQRVRLPHGGDEIGQLADTFDEMIARIEAAFSTQQASEERMRQFIADASHELRTPLTSIRGYTDVLLRGAKDDPETVQQVLLATRREAERMSRLVNDLLTLARLDTGRPLELRPVDVIALAGEAVDQARILAGEREVTLRSDGQGALLVRADPDRLKQVLLVLLDNALKYGQQSAAGWVHVRVWRGARAALISVTDNGPGIAPENLPHVFDRFYREARGQRHRTPVAGPVPSPASAPEPSADAGGRNRSGATPPSLDRPEGSGLGLAIAQAIVGAHGGTLSVQSEPGTGTTFTVALPLASE